MKKNKISWLITQMEKDLKRVVSTEVDDGGYIHKIILGPIGMLNGYIGIPNSEMKYYQDIDFETSIDCHGGITFEQPGEKQKPPIKLLKIDDNGNTKLSLVKFPEPVFSEGYYWIGFDTAHLGDSPNLEMMKKYEIEEMFCGEKVSLLFGGGKVWEVDDIKEELINIVLQLREIKLNKKEEEK